LQSHKSSLFKDFKICYSKGVTNRIKIVSVSSLLLLLIIALVALFLMNHQQEKILEQRRIAQLSDSSKPISQPIESLPNAPIVKFIATDNSWIMWEMKGTIASPIESQGGFLTTYVVIDGEKNQKPIQVVLGYADGSINSATYSGELKI
jgi:hypothetical protein